MPPFTTPSTFNDTSSPDPGDQRRAVRLKAFEAEALTVAAGSLR